MVVGHVVVIALFLFIHTTMANHFRGGTIQWRPVDAQNYNGELEIIARMNWRRSSFGYTCDIDDIGTTRLFGIGITLRCLSGCTGNIGDLQIYCTDFDVEEDWMTGVRTSTFTVGTDQTSFEAAYVDGNWVSLAVGGGLFELRMKGDLTPRPDNGLINSSPMTAFTPIVRVQAGCHFSIRIPVSDVDQDVVRCRWTPQPECGGICQTVEGAILNEETCVLSWDVGTVTGFYGAAINVEDFISSTSTIPLSSIPLQFLLDVFSSPQMCTEGSRPTLVPGETPEDGSCIAVPFGSTYSALLVADSGGADVSITHFITVSPFGLRTANVGQVMNSFQHYHANATWTPSSDQFGPGLFCFRAVNSLFFETSQSCITLLSGVSELVALSAAPVGKFTPTATTQWSITFNKAIARPSSSRYVRLYDSSGDNVFSFDMALDAASFTEPGSDGRNVTFTFSYDFAQLALYYVLLDEGVAVGTEFCKPGSLEITSSSFWMFSTDCLTGYTEIAGNCSDIDECLASPCDSNATCTNTDGGFTCSCNTGYHGDGFTCEADIDECSEGLDECASNATCANTESSYTCSCDTGYHGDGFTCEDTDECSEGLDACHSSAVCTNTEGSYECQCHDGFRGDGHDTCNDIDECFERTDMCTSNATCANIEGDYNCSCDTGYYGDGFTCEDIDECSEGLDVCASNATCSNTEGDYNCSCDTGYHGNGFTCEDIDECSEGLDECASNATCANTESSYTCSCDTGYHGDGFTCEDTDECSEGLDACHSSAVCTNTEGSYECQCHDGFRGDGHDTCNDIDECFERTGMCASNATCSNTEGDYNCSCDTGYHGDGFTCEDIDECSEGLGVCTSNATCSNTEGGYNCSCDTGYHGDGFTCEDIDECSEGLDVCASNAICSNTEGDYNCSCDTGYHGDGFTCEDIDECSEGLDVCASNAICSNTEGDYNCSCDTGYHGDGFTCEDIDECSEGLDVCASNATCSNTEGDYNCSCDTGYHGDGFTCEDIDECSEGLDVCASNATCSNTEGDYNCSCDTGYHGDGFTCEDIDECSEGLDVCASNAICSNTEGGYNCSCDTGYHGDGITCEDIDECATGSHQCQVIATCNNSIGSYQCLCPAGSTASGMACSEPSEPPSALNVTTLNATTVTASWTPPPPEDSKGVIQGYLVRVVGLHTPEDHTFSVVSTEATIGDLHPFYLYNFSLATVTSSHGPGPFGDPVTVRMPSSAPSDVVKNVSIELLSPTSVRLVWTPSSPEEWNGIISSYTIEYRQHQVQDDHYCTTSNGEESGLSTVLLQHTLSSPSEVFTNNPDPTLVTDPLLPEEWVLNDLEEDFWYSLTIYYNNSAGRSDGSDMVELKMPNSVPSGSPANVSVTAQSESSVVVQWSPPELFERNGVIEGYEVLLSYTSSNDTNRTYSLTGNVDSIIVEGIPSYTEVEVAVAARTSVGTGPMSVSVLETTFESVPGPPESVRVTPLNETRVELFWSPPSHINGRLLEYQARYFGYNASESTSLEVRVQDGPYVRATTPNHTSLQIGDLEPSLTYSFKVRAATAQGYGPYSTEITNTHLEFEVITGEGECDGVRVNVVLILVGIALCVLLVLIVVIVLMVIVNVWRRCKYNSKADLNARVIGHPVGVENAIFDEMDESAEGNSAAGSDNEYRLKFLETDDYVSSSLTVCVGRSPNVSL